MAVPFFAKAVADTKATPRHVPRSRRRGSRLNRDELVHRGRVERNAQRAVAAAVEAEMEAHNNDINWRLLNEARSLNSTLGSTVSGVRKIRAIVATSSMSWTILPFWVPQICMWMLGLSGLGLEATPIADIIFPGMELFMVAHLVIVFIGVCSMAFAAWVYTMRLVPCFSGNLTLVFILCLTGYLVVFINFVPWVAFYMIAVVLHSSKKEPEEA